MREMLVVWREDSWWLLLPRSVAHGAGGSASHTWHLATLHYFSLHTSTVSATIFPPRQKAFATFVARIDLRPRRVLLTRKRVKLLVLEQPRGSPIDITNAAKHPRHTQCSWQIKFASFQSFYWISYINTRSPEQHHHSPLTVSQKAPQPVG